MSMHADQLPVPPGTVRRLVDEQFPEWRDLPIGEIRTQGTVNAIFRIGDGLAARFPLRPGDVARTRRALADESAAVRELLAGTRFAVPEPVALGEPGHGYPLPWSVQTWLPGATAAEEDPAGSAGFAQDLATLIGEIRAIGTRRRTFAGDNRGGDLKRHDAWMATCLARSEGLLDVPRLRAVWARLRELPRRAPDLMTHGDLIPGNVLVSDGRLAGVLDAGSLGPADPALDLAPPGTCSTSCPATGSVRRSTVTISSGARPGVGVRAGDGRRLVLRADQPRHEPDGPATLGGSLVAPAMLRPTSRR